MAVNQGYQVEPARDKQNTTALRVAELQVVDGRIVRDLNPGVKQ